MVVTPLAPVPLMRHSTEGVPSYGKLSVEKEDQIPFLKTKKNN